MAAPTSCPHCKSERLGVGRWSNASICAMPVFKCLDCKQEINDRDLAVEFLNDIFKATTK